MSEFTTQDYRTGFQDGNNAALSATLRYMDEMQLGQTNPVLRGMMADIARFMEERVMGTAH